MKLNDHLRTCFLCDAGSAAKQVAETLRKAVERWQSRLDSGRGDRGCHKSRQREAALETDNSQEAKRPRIADGQLPTII